MIVFGSKCSWLPARCCMLAHRLVMSVGCIGLCMRHGVLEGLAAKDPERHGSDRSGPMCYGQAAGCAGGACRLARLVDGTESVGRV